MINAVLFISIKSSRERKHVVPVASNVVNGCAELGSEGCRHLNASRIRAAPNKVRSSCVCVSRLFRLQRLEALCEQKKLQRVRRMSHRAPSPSRWREKRNCPCRFVPISCCTKCTLRGTDAGGVGVTCDANVLAWRPLNHLWGCVWVVGAAVRQGAVLGGHGGLFQSSER